MGDAAACESIQGFVQAHGIRGGKRARNRTCRRDDAERAERGGFLIESRPNLPDEIGNRCLAAGPRDSDDRLRLLRVETRGRLRQGEPDVGRLNEGRRPDLLPWIALGNDRDRAALDGLRHKGQAVGFASRHREKYHVRRYSAAVGADALDLADGYAVRNFRLWEQFG